MSDKDPSEWIIWNVIAIPAYLTIGVAALSQFLDFRFSIIVALIGASGAVTALNVGGPTGFEAYMIGSIGATFIFQLKMPAFLSGVLLVFVSIGSFDLNENSDELLPTMLVTIVTGFVLVLFGIILELMPNLFVIDTFGGTVGEPINSAGFLFAGGGLCLVLGGMRFYQHLNEGILMVAGICYLLLIGYVFSAVGWITAVITLVFGLWATFRIGISKYQASPA